MSPHRCPPCPRTVHLTGPSLKTITHLLMARSSWAMTTGGVRQGLSVLV